MAVAYEGPAVLGPGLSCVGMYDTFCQSSLHVGRISMSSRSSCSCSAAVACWTCCSLVSGSISGGSRGPCVFGGIGGVGCECVCLMSVVVFCFLGVLCVWLVGICVDVITGEPGGVVRACRFNSISGELGSVVCCVCVGVGGCGGSR